MPTNRKFGVEMEGYINTYPGNATLANGATIKQDCSLRNSHWGSLSNGSDYGVEIITPPLRNIDSLNAIFGAMQSHRWHVDNNAGTHVHIDISDYSEYDKAKLLRFAKGIERIIFMFVKDYRSDNRYCQNLHAQWRDIFKPIKKTNRQRVNGRLRYITEEVVLDIERLTRRNSRSGTITNLLQVLHDNSLTNCDNSKYYWLNIYGSRHSTAEFRIFHAVESLEEVKSFVRIAHNIVDLCKASSKEQLEFILMSLYESKDTTALRNNFLELLSLENMSLQIKGTRAQEYLQAQLIKRHEQRVQKANAKLSLTSS